MVPPPPANEPGGVEKPHPPIFRAALQRANVPPNEVLHIGDQIRSDVAGARNMGNASRPPGPPATGTSPSPTAPKSPTSTNSPPCWHPKPGPNPKTPSNTWSSNMTTENPNGDHHHSPVRVAVWYDYI